MTHAATTEFYKPRGGRKMMNNVRDLAFAQSDLSQAAGRPKVLTGVVENALKDTSGNAPRSGISAEPSQCIGVIPGISFLCRSAAIALLESLCSTPANE